MNTTATISRLDHAYRFCARFARDHYENFTLGSYLLPKPIRREFYAIYAFCRYTDDLGDEAIGDRLDLLSKWETEFSLALGDGSTHPIMIAVADTIRKHDIPENLFLRLIEANRMDQGLVRFDSYQDLLQYCDFSANPVGEMVLHLLGEATEVNRQLSNYSCTALQLTNFWQDIARDYAANRVYIPLQEMNEFGVSEQDLGRRSSTESLKRLVQFEVERTRKLFYSGLPLVERIDGTARFDITLFSHGGLKVLRAIREQSYDVLINRPTLTALDKLGMLAMAAIRIWVLRRRW